MKKAEMCIPFRFIPLLIFFQIHTLLIGNIEVTNFEEKIHQYYEGLPSDPFTLRIEELKEKGKKFQFKSEKQYLLWLLETLEISRHSQLLVYSTTSLQLSRISPRNPRAIYFSDDIYIGYVPGGQIEVIGIDPKRGSIPYIFDFPSKNSTLHPTIYRSKRCMKCHASPEIGGAPSLLISSVVPGPGGGSIDAFRKNTFGHELSYSVRFGGWHISGKNPFPESWANQVGIMQNEEIHRILTPPGKFFDWNKYPANTSDISAHLTLEHQVGFINRCIRINYKLRDLEIDNTTKKAARIFDFIDRETDKLLSYILFENEPLLTRSGIIKENSYQNDFQTSSGSKHILRQLNLKTRLLENRCSYMIFSNSFTGLPPNFKNLLLKKLHTVLTAKSKNQLRFQYLGDQERLIIHRALANSNLNYALK